MKSIVGGIIGFLCGIAGINPYELGYNRALEDVAIWARKKKK